MISSILVTYATKYGSTQEVAETIATMLRESGLRVTVQAMAKVRALDGFDAVVLGAPIYIGRLYKDAVRFLERHREALAKRPVAVFSLGPIHAVEEERQGARQSLDQELAKLPWLTPVAIEMFGGKYDPAKLRFPDNLLTKMPTPLRDQPASDVRDWAAIRAWAGDLPAKLRPVEKVVS